MKGLDLAPLGRRPNGAPQPRLESPPPASTWLQNSSKRAVPSHRSHRRDDGRAGQENLRETKPRHVTPVATLGTLYSLDSFLLSCRLMTRRA